MSFQKCLHLDIDLLNIIEVSIKLLTLIERLLKLLRFLSVELGDFLSRVNTSEPSEVAPIMLLLVVPVAPVHFFTNANEFMQV